MGQPLTLCETGRTPRVSGNAFRMQLELQHWLKKLNRYVFHLLVVCVGLSKVSLLGIRA